jgi:predicted phage-related endonuclease
MKAITSDWIRQQIEELKAENIELEGNVKLYQESIEKGLTGMIDLKWKALDQIDENNRYILLLEKPELNPQLTLRFDISPKALKIECKQA